MAIVMVNNYPHSMSKDKDFSNFRDFWPYYLSEHSRHETRLIHIAGTGLSLGLFTLFILFGHWWYLLSAVLAGYGLAWISHVFLERNRPATFTHPIWSFMGDFRMFVLACAGRLNNELKKYGIGT